jgi:hypothetical protein
MFEAIKPLLQGDLTITEEMLRPLSNEERSVVAPRLQDAMPQGRQSMQAMMPATSSSQSAGQPPAQPWSFDSASWPGGPATASQSAIPQALQPFPSGPPGSMPPAAPSWPSDPNAPSNAAISGTTFSPTSESVRSAIEASSKSRRSRARLLLAAGTVLSLFGGGFAGYKLLGLGDAPAGPAAAEAPATPPKEPQPPAPTEPAGGEDQTVVSLEIIPANATVVVDGQPVKPEAGRVAIKGALGSTHTVRVSAGGLQASHEVAVTKGGALPPKIEITPAAPKPGPFAQPGQPAAKPAPARTSSPAPPLDLRTNR